MVNYKEKISLSVSFFVSLQVSTKEKSKKRFFKMEHWRLSKKVKYLIAGVIIAAMLISVFAFSPKESVTEANSISQNTEGQTNSSSITEGQTNSSSITEGQTNSSSITATAPQIPKISDSPGVGSFTPWGYLITPHLIGSTQTINNDTWMQVAENAWGFYKPNVGVDSNTGLPYAAGSSFRSFTDWDLGSYIQAVIDAQKIGLVDINGTWGSYARFDKVLTFLENRPLNAYGYPFQFYDAATGRETSASRASTTIAEIVDLGKLFVALNNLRNFNSAFAPRINSIVLSGRSNYTALIADILNNVQSKSTYRYYAYSGFASFWPQQLGAVPTAILSNILNSQNITTYGVSLPNARICNEPLLSSFFELNNSDSHELKDLITQVYFACEAYFSSTGHFMAPSEGMGGGGSWWYEWVVAPNGEPWRITDTLGNYEDEDTASIVYNKVAFSFLALYNTDFARSMVVWLEDTLPNPINGYYDGRDNYGRNYLVRSNIANTLILDAALYALQKV